MAYGENIFTGIIGDNGDIFLASSSREQKKVGIDNRREGELIQEIRERDEAIQDRDELIENWRTVLIENGLLEIPKTPEELAQEMAQEQLKTVQESAAEQLRIAQEAAQQNNLFMSEMLKTMQSMQYQIEELKNNEYIPDTRKVHDERNSSIIVVEPSPKQSGNDSQSDGKTSTTNKRSSGTSKKNSA